MATMDEFKTILPQCYENYMGDDQITVDLRHAFEAFLAGVDLTGLSVPEAEDKLRYEIDQFSHSWQQRGREMAAAAETLGCLRELAGTARYVARAVGGISQAPRGIGVSGPFQSAQPSSRVVRRTASQRIPGLLVSTTAGSQPSCCTRPRPYRQ